MLYRRDLAAKNGEQRPGGTGKKQVANIIRDYVKSKCMKPVPETRSTLSEGVHLVKPRGLSGRVVIVFPFK